MENLHENEKSQVAGRTFKFLSSVVSDVGIKRTENQDAFSVSHTRDASLFIVADGMGGAKGGATASTLAASIVGTEAFNLDGSISVGSFKRVVEQANLAIHARSVRDRDLKGMGTTIAGLAFVGEDLLICSVGDSRIYFLRDKDFRQLTKDHTLVQELVDNGAIKLEDAASHPISHMLTRSLGPVDKVNVDTFEFDLKVSIGDRFLICSDGLYNHVKPDEIRDEMALGKPKEICQKLLKMALDRGGSDNVTIQVIEVLALSDSSFAFPLPAPDKLEINLLGQIKQRVVGQELAEEEQSDEVNDFDFNELISDCDTPSGVGRPTVVPVEQKPFNLYIGGSVLVLGLLALFFIVKGSETKQSRSIEKQVFQEQDSPSKKQAPTIKEAPKKTPQIEVTVEPASIEFLSSEMMSKVLDKANSLTIPDAPKVKVLPEQVPLDQPIVWENEERKLIKLKEEPEDQGSDQSENEPTEELVYSGGSALQFAEVLEAKRNIRRLVSDLDFKLQLLVDGFKQVQQGKLVQEAEESKIVLNAIDAKLLEIEQELYSWKGFDKVYDQRAFLEFLQKRAATSESLSKLLEEYKVLDQKYLESVKAWQQNPRELSLASEMGAKARQKEEFFKSMQQIAHGSIETEVLKVLGRYAEKMIEKQNTEELLRSINRRKGFIESAFILDPLRTANIKEQYMSDREKLVSQLDAKRRQLPDEKELELHRNILVSELKTKL